MLEVKGDALEESFAAIEAQDDELEALKAEVSALKARVAAEGRPALSGVKGEVGAGSPFVERYLRRGLEAGVELKAFAGTSDAAGGYALPEELDAAIERVLKAVSPIRAIANVVRVGSSGYRKLVTSGGTPSGWAAEGGARAETDTPVFNEIAPPFGDLYANPAASQAMLDDAAFDVEGWLAGEIATEFARAEGAAFVSGDGTNKPKGFLAAANSDATIEPGPESDWSWKDGEGREVRFAATIRDAGEKPARLRRLLASAEAALLAMSGAPSGWRIVNVVIARVRTGRSGQGIGPGRSRRG